MALDVQAARDLVLSHAAALPAEAVPLPAALGRYLAADIVARGTLPPADNSAMDGYAVRSADLAAASAEQPVTVRVAAVAEAGRPTAAAVGQGEAIRIFTGAVLPAGADAVVMQEATAPHPTDPGRVCVRSAVPPGANVRRAGEEYRPGDPLLPAGSRLNPPAIGLLASDGWAEVPVHRRPRVALLVTGSELYPVEATELPLGALRDSNGPMLSAALQAAGAELVALGRAVDLLDEVADWLSAALAPPPAKRGEAGGGLPLPGSTAEDPHPCPSPASQGREADPDRGRPADVLLTSGGASVGDRDVIADAWERVGIETLFWGVAMKPGKPLRFGRFAHADGATTLCFALPGNPLAALTGFEQFVAPVLAVLSGAGWTPPPRLRLPLAEAQPAGRARTYLLRAGFAPGAGGASPAPTPGTEALLIPSRQGSAMLREAALQPLVAVLTGPGDAPAGALTEAIAEPAALAGRVLRPVGPLPPAVGVRGRSNSGKTTLVEQLLPHVAAAGLRVGTVKHASHPPELDLPGKDSHRHGQAGARQVLLLGPGKAALYFHAATDEELGPWLEWFAGRVDIVVVEGFKRTAMPHVQIEVGGEAALQRGRLDGWPRWLLTRPEGEGGRFAEELVSGLAAELVAGAAEGFR